jgi:hypothetical protein
MLVVAVATTLAAVYVRVFICAGTAQQGQEHKEEEQSPFFDAVQAYGVLEMLERLWGAGIHRDCCPQMSKLEPSALSLWCSITTRHRIRVGFIDSLRHRLRFYTLNKSPRSSSVIWSHLCLLQQYKQREKQQTH